MVPVAYLWFIASMNIINLSIGNAYTCIISFIIVTILLLGVYTLEELLNWEVLVSNHYSNST